MIDHDESYVDLHDHNVPAAIVSHTYVSREGIEAFTAKQGLAAEFLPFSWYFTAGCTAVLFTVRAAEPAA